MHISVRVGFQLVVLTAVMALLTLMMTVTAVMVGVTVLTAFAMSFLA